MINSPVATILIVDDEIRNRKLLETLLQPEGYLTLSAANGEDALASIAHSPPDLILLDIMMPGIDGYEVAAILKANAATANIPIIMVTALVEHKAHMAGLDAGAESILAKPVDRTELWLKVRNLLRLKAFGDLQDYSLVLEQQVKMRTADLQRFRAAMDLTADAIMLVNRNTMRFVEANATASNMLGYTLEELLQIDPSQLGTGTLAQIKDVYDGLIAAGGTTAMTETFLRRKDGSLLQVEIRRHAQHCDALDWIIVCVVRDITERKEVEKRLHHLAYYDTLTGLPNRTLFYKTLQKTMVHASDNGWQVAVLFIDLDQFKNVNDTLGHAIGDELLSQFSNRLAQCVRIRDIVGRLGGDEFAVILVMEDAQQGAALVANKIRDVLCAPFYLNGHEVAVTASIGIAIHPDDASDPEILLRYADTAMYQAKQEGRATSRFFTAQMNTRMVARLDLETALHKAVDNNEFILYYQPKVQISTGRIIGVEALLRWMRPDHGMVLPGDFIPLLEETGLIVQVGAWVINAACKQIAAWTQSVIGPIHVAVNVSSRQFVEEDLEAVIVNAIRRNNIKPEFLELELTESALMSNPEQTIVILENLKELGVRISIDDFGTGYSSLAYLKRFPIDTLKIDIAFIRDVTTNPDDAAIVLAIINLAHSLKLQVIAEGVETEMQLAYLRRHNCNQIQGFYISGPLPVFELEQMLCEDRHLSPVTEDLFLPLQTLLVIDSEVSALTELTSILRQDGYRILSASSAVEAFKLLALNPVQVILCGQYIEGIERTTFFDLVKDLYPKTFRIVLSMPTDLAPIVDEINRGAIHRFYTKPWENKTLRSNIRDAFLKQVPGMITMAF